jgi:class 3 adenylate cyclase/tRNA A-37 threonylcarbamoyl transferase component Bud32
VGQVLCDRYRVTREIGSGGFGTVYLAQDEKLVSKPVVVKVLNHLTADTWAVRKFHQEIEALARIDHPGVVAVLDEGQTPEGAPFLVMQFIDGVTLRKLIKPGGMDLHSAAAILRQIGSALGAAHEKGVFHRDLKPENIMVQTPDTDPRVRLIDFGIAGIKDSVFSQTEQSTRIAGTYRYMPPEQMEGRVCQESDVYAFGAIAYELLTGQPPVKSPLELIAIKIDGLKVKPRDLRPELPIAAQNVILKALSFETSDRYSSAREMGDLLADVLQGIETRGTAPFTEATRATVPANDRLEIAHVLFLDLVGFSALTMEDQRALLDTLQTLVRGTPHFAQADTAHELIALPTGDGMALVFFANPITAAECALDIARAARSNPALLLRTGLHSGPVFRVADINKNLNVTGGGINMAQRVMDAGDAGHILVSGALAETLAQFAGWKQRLSDLGEHTVKHGATMRFYNLCTEDAGNPDWPAKWKPAETKPTKSRTGLIIGALAVALAAGAGIYFATRPVPIEKKVVVPTAPRLELEVAVSFQDFKGDDPVGQPYPMALGDTLILRGNDHAAITLVPPRDGYVYILNDGPMMGKDVVFVEWPAPDGSPQVSGGKSIRLPGKGWLQADSELGEEKLYLIFSPEPVAEVEALKGLGTLISNTVVLQDEAHLKSLRIFLEALVEKTQVKKDDQTKKAVLSTDQKVLVYRIRLPHH